MRYKILTVDDSKTVRIIVKKAFKAYDCEILEAGNGVEGLAMATKERPDLILLDVTMPVMDGAEMLTRLKADNSLRGIPVIMLTAEGGRDNVIKIARLGVRDYIVKPFREETLVEKTGKVIELRPISTEQRPAKSILDPCTIIVVEDKPAIVEQIQEGLKHTPWKILAADTTADAVRLASSDPLPDLIMISLSLPDDAAFTLFRLLRSSTKTKNLPLFGLVVKTDLTAQQRAQEAGFAAFLTKPLDLIEMEGKLAKAMHLDTSRRFYWAEGDFQVMKFPEVCTESILLEMNDHLRPKIAHAVDCGLSKCVIDLSTVRTSNMALIKFLFQTMQTFREVGMRYALVGSEKISAECKGYEDTRNWTFHFSLEDAKASLAGTATSTAANGG